MPYEIEFAEVPSLPIAAIQARTSWAAYPTLWPRLRTEVHAHVHRPAGRRPGLNVMLYLDDQPTVEVGILLADGETLSGRVRTAQLPSGPVARTSHRGDYGGLGAAHEAIHTACVERGRRTTGVRWEIYGHWSENPHEVTTDVIYQLEV